MGRTVELARAPEPSVLDGAVAIALATGSTLRLAEPPRGAGAEIVLAAAQLSRNEAVLAAARAALSGSGPVELSLPAPQPGPHALSLREPGSVARVATSLCWPLALAGGRSELRLRGPNHGGSAPGFHDLTLAWSAQVARFGLRAALELRAAAFAVDPSDQGELVLSVEGLAALNPVHLAHRGLLRQVTLLAGSGASAHDEARRALEEALRLLRLHGVNAEAERVPLPPPRLSGSRRWVLTAVADLEHIVVSTSATPEGPSSPGPGSAGEPEALGARVASAVDSFLSSHGALDGPAAERMLLPAILCAAGAGQANPPPSRCLLTTTEITSAQIALASLAHTLLPVRAALDGSPGSAGVLATAPA